MDRLRAYHHGNRCQRGNGARLRSSGVLALAAGLGAIVHSAGYWGAFGRRARVAGEVRRLAAIGHLSRYGLSGLMAQPGSGDLPFPLAVDLVVALPLSWLPLAADYNRFARSTRSAFLGTYFGFFVANVWFFALGAVAVLALQTQDLIASILALTIGGVALIIILADETDNAFADIYSAAVSTRNFLTGTSHWKLAAFFGFLGFVAAVLLPIERYEAFLLLLGSLFAPLFGVVAADYFLLRRRHLDVQALYEESGAYGYRKGV